MKLNQLKNQKGRKNPVAKNMGINKASTHKDKKKNLNIPRKSEKHKKKFLEESFQVFCENEKVWTKDEIKEKLKTNDEWLMRGLLAIYDRQTEDEKQDQFTKHHNSVGFSGVDGDFLSSLAKQLRERGFLTPKQTAHARKQMLKYSGQLTKIANKKI